MLSAVVAKLKKQQPTPLSTPIEEWTVEEIAELEETMRRFLGTFPGKTDD
jgi:hypothetical protein